MTLSDAFTFAVLIAQSQWDASPHAGFTTGNPWMRVNDDYAETWNASEQVSESTSVWTFWKQALATRKEHEVLVRCLLQRLWISVDPLTASWSDLRRFQSDSLRSRGCLRVYTHPRRYECSCSSQFQRTRGAFPVGRSR